MKVSRHKQHAVRKQFGIFHDEKLPDLYRLKGRIIRVKSVIWGWNSL